MSAADPNEGWVTEVVTEHGSEPASIVPDEVRSGGQLAPVEDPPEDQTTALDRAVSAALAAPPGFASRDEFLTLCMKARMLSMSELAPKDLAGKPYNMLLVLMTGRSLSLDETAAMRKVYVIDGQTSLAPQLEVALIRRWKLGDVVPHPENSKTWAGAIPLNQQGEPIGDPVVFDWDDAVDAELVDPTCGPDPDRPGRIRHNRRRLQKRGRGGSTYTVDNACLCKDNYRHYGQDMLYWRAVGRCVRFYFSEVGLGLYSPDELGALTDDQGEPIDPTTVELPPGFTDPQAEQRQRAEDAQRAAEAPADPDELWSLQERVYRLPEDIRRQLAQAWDADDCNVKGYALHDGTKTRPILPAAKLRVAKALVNAWEGKAKQAGVDLDEAMEQVRGAVATSLVGFLCWSGPPRTDAEPPADQPPDGPESAPEADSAPITHPDAPEAEDASYSGQDEAAVEDPDSPDDEEPPYERPDGAPEPDWRAQSLGLAATVRRACEGVPPNVIERIAAEVKALHWQHVNTELDEAGVPHQGAPIDLRRMHVSLLRIRAFRTAQGLPDVPHYEPAELPEPRRSEEPF